ncbi:hypothetical protein [Allosphingosinicella deserti]|uniref:Phage late control D family protein n=1 Tax=Allosphingosinicella deserti TaxID=2116704 RepID=A0A2P7QZG7_9SPHN|nr:hypothetical protein [Sphingomonas deserti]PSJ43355.1 hypothetical protein C7I55_03025 [Sphingomonas deserti]
MANLTLSLLIGPAVPIPAPQDVIDALTGITVNHDATRSGFQLTFAVSKDSPLLTTMLPVGYFDPISTRVVIIATIGGFPHVLMDGLVTQQQLQPSSDPGESTLTITGEDLSVAMDIVSLTRPFPAMNELAIVNLILAPYLALGIVPMVIPPIVPIVQTPVQGWDTQTNQTDRAYIGQIAARCGYVFFVRPGPLPLQSVAYFGPDVDLPIPQPALSINMDAHTNVESLSFTLNGLAKKIRVFTIFDPFTRKIPIPVPLPNVNAFKPPLGLRPTPPARIEFDTASAKLSPDKAARNILGFLLNKDNAAAISGSGSLDVMRYGHVLEPRMLVGVRGAGLAYDGLYYVDSVTHTLKKGSYKQDFTLSRDGLISNTPLVPA